MWKKKQDVIFAISLGIVSAVILLITLLNRQPEERIAYLIPLWSYKRILEGNWRSLYENICNILMFMPLGFLLPVLFHTNKRITTIVGFFLSVIIETLQFSFALGSFEVDDLINNTLGSFLGYILSLKVQASESELSTKKNIRIIGLSALITIVIAFSYQTVSGILLRQEMIRFSAMNDRQDSPNILVLDGKNGHTWDSDVQVRYQRDGSISISGTSDIQSWFLLGTQTLDEGKYVLSGLTDVEPKTVAVEVAFFDEEQNKYVQAIPDLGPNGDIHFTLVRKTLIKTFVRVYPECDCDVVARPAIYKEGEGV